MLYPTGAAIPFAFMFTNSKAGATGLTVTVSVVRVQSDGTTTTIITQASNTAATEVDSTNAKGLYRYWLAGANTGTAGIYLAIAHTAGTVDQADVPALEIVGPTWVQNSSSFVDVAISSRNAGAVTLQANQHVIADSIPSVQSDVTAGLTTQGYTTTRAGYLDTLNGLVQAIWDKATSALSTVGSVGKLLVTNVDAAISSRLPTSSYSSPLTSQQVENAVWDATASSHNTAGTTGNKLNSAASAGDPLTSTVPGNYAVGTAGYKLGQIGTTSYTIVSPIAQGGTLTLLAGSSYKHSLGTHIPWSYNNPLGLDITGATSTFALVDADPATTGTVTITTFSGASLAGYFEFTATQTAALSGSYVYEHVISYPSGDPVIVARGALVVQ